MKDIYKKLVNVKHNKVDGFLRHSRCYIKKYKLFLLDEKYRTQQLTCNISALGFSVYF